MTYSYKRLITQHLELGPFSGIDRLSDELKMYKCIKHQQIEDTYITNTYNNHINSSFNILTISLRLRLFLDSWNVFTNKDRFNVVLIELDRGSVKIIKQDNTIQPYYTCNTSKVFNTLNKITKVKTAKDKMLKHKANGFPSYNQLILASLVDTKTGLQILDPYDASAILKMKNDPFFKHCYKLVHPDTVIHLNPKT